MSDEHGDSVPLVSRDNADAVVPASSAALAEVTTAVDTRQVAIDDTDDASNVGDELQDSALTQCERTTMHIDKMSSTAVVGHSRRGVLIIFTICGAFYFLFTWRATTHMPSLMPWSLALLLILAFGTAAFCLVASYRDPGSGSMPIYQTSGVHPMNTAATTMNRYDQHAGLIQMKIMAFNREVTQSKHAASIRPGERDSAKHGAWCETKVWTTTCKVCHEWQKPRGHHCKDCNKCVARRDHHCFWVGNCIGRRNHLHFMFFLGGLGLCLVVQLIGSITILVLVWHKKYVDAKDMSVLGHIAYALSRVIYSIPDTILCICCTAAIVWYPVSLFYILLCNVSRGRTMIENKRGFHALRQDTTATLSHQPTPFEYVEVSVNPFDRGLVRNWLTFLLQYPTPPEDRMHIEYTISDSNMY